MWLAYKQAKTSNKCAECCCPSSVQVNKGTLFTILLLVNISDDNKHLAKKKKKNRKTKIVCGTSALPYHILITSTNIKLSWERIK